MRGKILFFSSLAVLLGLGALCGYIFCVRTDFDGAGLESLIPAYLALLIVSVPFSDFVHEGAHLIVGLCLNMGIKPDRYRIFRTSSVNVCPKGVKHMRLRMILTASAGVAINLACAAIGIISILVPQVPATLCVLLPYSAYLFLLNAVPAELSGGKNDGMIVWELLTLSDSAKVMLVILRIQGSIRSGIKLEEIPEAMLFEVPQLPEDDINFIILTQLRYEYYLAVGNDSEAYKYFMRYKDLIKYLPSEYKKSADKT